MHIVFNFLVIEYNSVDEHAFVLMARVCLFLSWFTTMVTP